MRMKLNKRLLAEALENLMMRDNPAFREAYMQQDIAFRINHRRELLQAWPAVFEAYTIAEADEKATRWLFKEWLEYALSVGLTPTLIAKKCGVPVLAIRASICYNRVIEFKSLWDQVKFLFTGKLKFNFDDHLEAPTFEIEAQESRDGHIFVKQKGGIWLPGYMALESS